MTARGAFIGRAVSGVPRSCLLQRKDPPSRNLYRPFSMLYLCLMTACDALSHYAMVKACRSVGQRTHLLAKRLR
jgi:hypothetical protein